MSDVLGGGWERRDDGAWIPRSERAHLKRRLRGALDASRPHFRAERTADGAKKGAKRGVEEVRLPPDSPSLRDACVDAWRGFGLTNPSQTRTLRRRAEQTLDIARRQATGDALHQVTFLTFKLALHRVAARHVAGLRLQLADARVARGDERGALHEYNRALTEERAGWARTGRLEWAPAASLLNAARLTRLRAKDQADLDDAERLLRAAYGSEAAGSYDQEAAAEDPAQENATEGTRRAARHDLCVLLCQSDYRGDDAADALTSMGYRYRLSEDVLRYDLNYGVVNVPRSLKRREKAMETHGKYVRVFDGAMPAPALHHLRSVVSLSFIYAFISVPVWAIVLTACFVHHYSFAPRVNFGTSTGTTSPAAVSSATLTNSRRGTPTTRAIPTRCGAPWTRSCVTSGASPPTRSPRRSRPPRRSGGRTADRTGAVTRCISTATTRVWAG